MKRLGKISMCLAGVLALSASARAQNAALPDNPYSRIVERNVFGLNPLPPPGSDQPPADPPPKITPNGIMSIFGQLQVLFKVAVTKPGQAAKDEFYTLSEGEQQDDIEVTHIDEAASTVTFNNHGVVQEIPLANSPGSNTPNSSGPAWGGGGAGGGGRFGGRFGGGPGGGPGGMRSSGAGYSGNNYNNNGQDNGSSSANNNNAFQSGPNYGSHNIQPPAMTAEENAIWIEAQRMQAQNEHSPIAPILPPTVLTPRNSPEGEPPAP